MNPPPLIAFSPPAAVPPTRAVPALEITVESVRGSETEVSHEGSYWPSGIDYASVSVPDPAPRETFLDSLDTLAFLDD